MNIDRSALDQRRQPDLQATDRSMQSASIHRTLRLCAAFALCTPLGCASSCPEDSTGASSSGSSGSTSVGRGDEGPGPPDRSEVGVYNPADFPPCTSGFTNLKGTLNGAPFDKSLPSDMPGIYQGTDPKSGGVTFISSKGPRFDGSEIRFFWYYPLQFPRGRRVTGKLFLPDDPATYVIAEGSILFDIGSGLAYKLVMAEGTLVGCSQ